MNPSNLQSSRNDSAKVLLVAESRLQSLVSQQQLERAGYAVSVVSNPGDVVATLQTQTVALVLVEPLASETVMLELCRRIRAEPSLAHLPVLLRFSNPGLYQVMAAIDAGASRALICAGTARDISVVVSEELAAAKHSSSTDTPHNPVVWFDGQPHHLRASPVQALKVLVAGLGDLFAEIRSLNAQQLTLKQQNYAQKLEDQSLIDELKQRIQQLQSSSDEASSGAPSASEAIPETMAIQLERAIHALPEAPLVLLVDDEPIARTMAASTLSKLGLKVQQFKDGVEVVDFLANWDDPVAMIFMDQLMPELDGMETTRAIRRMPGWQATPIIGLSGNADEESVTQCLESGMDDHLAKSPDSAPLCEKVGKWLVKAGVLPSAALVSQRIPIVAKSADDNSIHAAPQGSRQIKGLPGLPMVDAERAAMVASEPEKFRRMLWAFSNEYSTKIERLTPEVIQADKHTALLIAHSLKGAAATLGLWDISRSAGALESALKQSDTVDLKALLGSMNQGMTTFTQALENLPPIIEESGIEKPDDYSGDKPQGSEGASVDFGTVLTTLYKLTAEDNPKALDWFEQHQQRITDFNPPLCKQLEALVSVYDLSGASKMLRGVIRDLPPESGAEQ